MVTTSPAADEPEVTLMRLRQEVEEFESIYARGLVSFRKQTSIAQAPRVITATVNTCSMP
jgi:hypothetical protein